MSYILNDEEEAGKLAADRVASLLNGKGTVALLGINPDVLGITTRARVFETTLATNYPDIRIVEKRTGTFNVLRERQVAEELLDSNPDIDAYVALLWTTLDGLFSAIDSIHPRHSIKIIGFDLAGEPPFEQRQVSGLRNSGRYEVDGSACGRTDPRHSSRDKRFPPSSHLKPAPHHAREPALARDPGDVSYDWSLGRWTWSATP